MIEALGKLFAVLIAELVSAGEDKAKQEAALMSAEEQIARLRAKRKFG